MSSSDPDRAARVEEQFSVTAVLPVTRCPTCLTEVDGATGTREPQSGDIAVCLYCASVNQYGPNMQLQEASQEALLRMSVDELLWLAEIRRAVIAHQQGDSP